MVRRMMQGNAHMAEMQRAAIAICDQHRDPATSNVLQEILDQTERRTWFLFEVEQGLTNTD
jgi:starvation-inducible DNA-binding protein